MLSLKQLGVQLEQTQEYWRWDANDIDVRLRLNWCGFGAVRTWRNSSLVCDGKFGIFYLQFCKFTCLHTHTTMTKRRINLARIPILPTHYLKNFKLQWGPPTPTCTPPSLTATHFPVFKDSSFTVPFWPWCTLKSQKPPPPPAQSTEERVGAQDMRGMHTVGYLL